MTIRKIQTQYIPDGEDVDGVIKPGRYVTTEFHDDNSTVNRTATPQEIKKYRVIMGKIDAGRTLD